MMQTASRDFTSSFHDTEFYKQGTFRAIYSVISKEGLRGLYNGVAIHYYKTAPSVAISFVTYEYLKKLGAELERKYT